MNLSSKSIDYVSSGYMKFDGKNMNYACLVKFDGKNTNYACLVKFDILMLKKNLQIQKKSVLH